MDLVSCLLRHDRMALARLVTRVENEEDGHGRVLSRIYRATGKAYHIGITGPPGAGKSTLVDGLAKRLAGKTNSLNDDDLAEFVKLQEAFADSPKSWSVDTKSIDKTTFDLSVKNPNSGEEVKHRRPEEIMNEIAALAAESAEVLGKIRKLL